MSSARSSTPTEAVILAGGLGTRLREVVSDVPKPMAPVNGRPFLEHQMDFYAAQGIRHFVLSVGYLAEVITKHFGDTYRGCAIDYAVETTPLGTGGGLLLSLRKLRDRGPFVVMNGDTFADVSLKDLAMFHAEHGAMLSMSLFRVAKNDRYQAVQIDDHGRIVSFKGGDTLVSGGVYMMERALLDGQWPEKISLEQDVFEPALAAGKPLFGMICPGRFTDIGLPADYHRVNA